MSYELLMKELQSDKKKDEQVETLDRVFNASNLFEVLSLSHLNTPIDPHDVRKQYKRIALLIHPDKCSLDSATDAFQKLSDAFEQLYDTNTQKTYALSLHISTQKQAKKYKPMPKRRWKKKKRNVWKDCSWKDFLENLVDLEHQEQREHELRSKFVSEKSLQYALKHYRYLLKNGINILQELQLQRSKETYSKDIPLEDDTNGTSNDKEASHIDIVTDVEIDLDIYNELVLDDQCSLSETIDGLSQLSNYLRSYHTYCLYCGSAFASMEELEAYCPGPLEKDH